MLRNVTEQPREAVSEEEDDALEDIIVAVCLTLFFLLTAVGIFFILRGKAAARHAGDFELAQANHRL